MKRAEVYAAVDSERETYIEDFWAIRRATPTQICRAALLAVAPEMPKEAEKNED